MKKTLDNDGWESFLAFCAKVKSEKEWKNFFDLFLTIEEKETLGKRFQIIKALQKGELTQREISAQFGVSISQITRGSNALKIIDQPLKNLLEDLL